jgi:hypothetical protein
MILASSNCPYCDLRPRNSDDHIFPNALAGKVTIRSCAKCNNTFGHAFEAAVISDLAPIMVILRSAGLPSPSYAVWKKAKTHEGIEIDIDTDLNSSVSRTLVEKDEQGMFKSAAFQTKKQAQKALQNFEKAGKKARLSERTLSPLKPSEISPRINIGLEMRRLAVKIGVAAADLLGHRTNILDPKSRAFLLNERFEGDAPVRFDVSNYPPLQELRPPLAHTVFVKGNSRTGHCYAVVMFYGFIQLYAILNDTDFLGSDFAVFGFLDPVTYKSEFRNIELIALPKPPQFLSHDAIDVGLKRLQDSFQDQAKTVFGENQVTFRLEYLGSQQ